MKKLVLIIMTVLLLSTAAVVFAEGASEPVDPLPESSEDRIDTLMSAVSSGTFWINTVSILGTALGCIALFKNRFDQMTSKLGKTATSAHLNEQVGTLAGEIKKALGERTETISHDISAMMEDYKLLLTCFTIFIESAKINSNAKKEILDRLTGIKAISEKVTDDVADALEAIKSANAAETPVLTPKTDEALKAAAEINSAMILD